MFKRVFSYTGRVLDRVLFYMLQILLPLFAIALVLFNFYASLVLLCIWLFNLPKRWSKSEFEWRFFVFLLTVVFLVMLFATSEIPHICAIGVIAFAGFSMPLLSNKYKWLFLELLDVEEVLTFAILWLMFAMLNLFGFLQLKDLIGISGFFLTFFMRNYLSTALRRAELTKFLWKLGGFKAPEDFIEKILEKSVTLEDEKRDFIRYRFSEFLRYVEHGAFEQAYIILATGTFELLNVWSAIKCNEIELRYKDDKGEVRKEKVTHNDIRAALVHSTPRHDISEEEKKRDLPRKKAILNKFRRDPFTPIKDLLDVVAEKYGIKTPTKMEKHIEPSLNSIFKNCKSC